MVDRDNSRAKVVLIGAGHLFFAVFTRTPFSNDTRSISEIGSSFEGLGWTVILIDSAGGVLGSGNGGGKGPCGSTRVNVGSSAAAVSSFH